LLRTAFRIAMKTWLRLDSNSQTMSEASVLRQYVQLCPYVAPDSEVLRTVLEAIDKYDRRIINGSLTETKAKPSSSTSTVEAMVVPKEIQPKEIQPKEIQPSVRRVMWYTARILLFDLPLLLLLLTLAAFSWVHHAHVHDHYLEPQLRAVHLPENATAEEAYQYFVDSRNRNLTAEESNFVIEDENQLSFGLGTQEPSVVKAMTELTRNKRLSAALEKIMGPNPALIEMTAITSHDDVIPTASVVNYSSAFGPSYSVFIQQQNTTKEMAATVACPAAHYCSAGDIEALGEEEGFQLVNEEGHWGIGDALLTNMTTWAADIKADPRYSSIEPTTVATKTSSRSPTARAPYTIRQMKMSDVATVFHLGNEIFTAAEFPTMYRTWDDFAVIEYFEGSGEFCFVAVLDHKEGEELVAFLLGEPLTKSNVGTRGYIQWVGVLPAYRRMGIATELIQAFKTSLLEENISVLFADTPADNHPAIRMFDKAGLFYKNNHVYLTRQMQASDHEITHVDEDGMFDFSYTAGHGANKKSFTIRNMEIDDLYPIYRIGEEIFSRETANLYNFWDEDLVLQSFLSNPDVAVVATMMAANSSKEVVVGFAFGATIEKPRSSWSPYGYLDWLGVDPSCQGMGLAAQMYHVMVELFAMEKVRIVMIDTQQNNKGALKFFRKLGFGHDEEHVFLSNSPMDD